MAAPAFERLPWSPERVFHKEVSRGTRLDLQCQFCWQLSQPAGGPRGQGAGHPGWVLSGDAQGVLKQAQKKILGLFLC